MRVLHAVQHQDQRFAARRLDQRRQGRLFNLPGRFVTRDHALVAQAAGDTIERLQGDTAHRDFVAARGFLYFGQPRILAAGFHQHLAHVRQIVFQRR